MTVETNWAICMLSDWRKSRPNFSTNETRANSTLYTRFFPRYEQAIVDSDWFIVLFAPIVITLLLGFQRSFKNDYNNNNNNNSNMECGKGSALLQPFLGGS